MQRGSVIVLSSITIAVISAQVITFYHNTSTKVIGAQCDKTRIFPCLFLLLCSFSVSWNRLSTFIVSSPNVCDNCLSKITPQDEQQVLISKTPIPQIDLRSEQPSSSESGNPGGQPSSGPSSSQSPPSEEAAGV